MPVFQLHLVSEKLIMKFPSPGFSDHANKNCSTTAFLFIILMIIQSVQRNCSYLHKGKKSNSASVDGSWCYKLFTKNFNFQWRGAAACSLVIMCLASEIFLWWLSSKYRILTIKSCVSFTEIPCPAAPVLRCVDLCQQKPFTFHTIFLTFGQSSNHYN